MGHGHQDAFAKKRQRGLSQPDKAPEPKKTKTVDSSNQEEAVRSRVRALYATYNDLCNGSHIKGAGAFEALLQASQGDERSLSLCAACFAVRLPHHSSN